MSGSEKKQKYLRVLSPANCYAHAGKLRTVSDVLKLPAKTLGELNRECGRTWVIEYISLWLIDLNQNAQVKNKMSEAQIEFTAERIYESYSLKVTDLTLFFRNVKEGVYGSYYETLSQEKIMSWLHEYWDQRCEAGELLSQGRHDGFSMSKDGVHPEVAKKMFEGVGEEKVEFDHEKNTLGQRVDRVLTKELGENKILVIREVKEMETAKLREYIATADFHSDDFDPYKYRLIEAELDIRNKKG